MPKSTRKKIREQIVKAADCQDRAIEHLAYAQGLAAGRSKKLEENVTNIAVVLQGCKALLLQFRDEL